MLKFEVLASHRFQSRSALLACLILAALGVVTAVVYFTGGTEGQFHALAHLYYVPTIAAALLFGPLAGALTGVGAAIFGGPLMPAEVSAGVVQPATDWVIRATFFVTIGSIVGALTQRLRNALEAERRQKERLNRIHETDKDETIAAFSEAIAQRDAYTGDHVDRITEHATAMARYLGLSPSEVDTVRHAAQLHDIGKLAVPTDILRKPGLLTRSEWRAIEEHPVIGSQILERVSFLSDAAALVYHHHERYDGTGYPDGLRGEDIPLGARIIAVADAFDAMTSDRPYRPALSHEQAVIELIENAGTQFDPEVVDALLHVLWKSNNGTGQQSQGVLQSYALTVNTPISNMIDGNGQCHVDVK